MVECWYDSSIEKIRFTANPGGEALTVEQAQERISEIENAVHNAKND